MCSKGQLKFVKEPIDKIYIVVAFIHVELKLILVLHVQVFLLTFSIITHAEQFSMLSVNL